MWPIDMATLAMKTSTLDVFVYVCVMDKHRPVLIKTKGVCAIAPKNFAICGQISKITSFCPH